MVNILIPRLSAVFLLTCTALILIKTSARAQAEESKLPIPNLPEISGSTVITEPFTNFLDSLQIDVGGGDPFFTRILNEAGGNGSEVRDILSDLKRLLEIFEELAQIIFKMFLTMLHFLQSLLNKLS